MKIYRFRYELFPGSGDVRERDIDADDDTVLDFAVAFFGGLREAYGDQVKFVSLDRLMEDGAHPIDVGEDFEKRVAGRFS